MKKFISWCLATLAAAIVAIAGSVAFISCDKTGPKVLKTAVGVKEVSSCLDSIVNPRLNTTKDVFELQNKLVVNAYIDSVFMSMDQKTLDNVAGVVLNKHHVVTKDDIVHEFIKNRTVYENLPDNSKAPTTVTKTEESTSIAPNVQIVKEGTTTVTEAPQTRVEEKPAGYKDTTVNGRHALISIQ